MKTKSTLLLALAMGLASLSTASAGLITDPLSIQKPAPTVLPAPPPPQMHQITQAPAPSPSRALPAANVPAAAQFLFGVLADSQTVRLSDLFLNPEFFAAAHAAGPEADALRGQIDWLMLTGVIIGFDGMDGSDDLFGGGGDDEVTPQATAPASNGIILGGPGGDTLAPFNPSIILGGPGGDTLQAPINGFVFGTTSYLQPAPLNWSWGETNFFTDSLLGGAVQPPVNGIILGGPGGDTIILGGPGGDTVAPQPVNGFVFGTTSYLK